MLYMVIELFRPNCAPDIYRRFRDHRRMALDSVQYVTSWVDLEFRRCFQVMETPNEAALLEWASHWSDLVDFEFISVGTSAEATAAIAPEL